MIQLQQFGFIETPEGVAQAMLCADVDRDDEIMLHWWGREKEPPLAAKLRLHWREDRTAAALEILQVFRAGEFGGLYLPKLTNDEIDHVTGYAGTLHLKADGCFDGTWAHKSGQAGKISLNAPSPDSVMAAQCASWSEFKVWASTARDESDASLFRGHGSNRFRLQTTLHRLKRTRLERYCDEMLPPFRLHAEAILSERIDTKNKDDYAMLLGLAQHHGLPAPILDWTNSPYVAAFFAYADAVEAAGTRATDTHIRVYGLTRQFTQRFFAPVVSLPDYAPYVSPLSVSPRNNPRMYAQQGQFLVTNVADVESFLRSIEKKSEFKVLIAADVPISCAGEALEDLAFMGLTAATMFPGLDGVCRMMRHSMTFKRQPVSTVKSPALGKPSDDPQGEIVPSKDEPKSSA